jgi:hypothetical protein
MNAQHSLLVVEDSDDDLEAFPRGCEAVDFNDLLRATAALIGGPGLRPSRSPTPCG